jgi:hypothetical protein
MDEVLLQAYRQTDYLVCLDAAEWACIGVDQLLPASLQRRVGTRPWGFITAWNPQSTVRPPEHNLLAQRELVAALQAMPPCVIFPAIGLGATGWHEPSLFVIGVDQVVLDALGRQHRQIAYVHGNAGEPARLRLLPTD